MRYNYHIILGLLRKYRRIIVQYLSIDLVLKFINVISAVFIMVFIDTLPVGGIDFVYKFGILFIAVQTYSVLSTLFKSLSLRYVELGVVADLRQLIVDRLLHATYSPNEQNKGSYLGPRVVKDTDSINNLLLEPVAKLISSVLFLGILLPILLQFHISVVILLLSSALLPATLAGWINAKIKDAAAKNQETHALYSSALIDSLDGVREVKLANSYRQELETIAVKLKLMVAAGLRQTFWNLGAGQTTVLIQQVVIGTMLILIGLQVQRGAISLGQAVFIYSIADNLFYVIMGFWGLFFAINNAMVSWGRIQELMNRDQEQTTNRATIDRIDSIVIKELKVFKGDRKVIDGLSFSVGPKAKLAIMGQTGAGKTTILNILVGLDFQQDGQIIFNEQHSLRDLDITAVRGRIAYFNQDSHIFDRTVSDNILYGSNTSYRGTTQQEAIEIVCLRDLDPSKHAGPEGKNLSGGEKQRVALARCLMRDFDVLLMDEFGSAVHKDMELAIYSNILKKYQDKIIISVTHKDYIASLFQTRLQIPKIREG